MAEVIETEGSQVGVVQDGIVGGAVGAGAEGGAGGRLQARLEATQLEDGRDTLLAGACAVIRNMVGSQTTAF